MSISKKPAVKTVTDFPQLATNQVRTNYIIGVEGEPAIKAKPVKGTTYSAAHAEQIASVVFHLLVKAGIKAVYLPLSFGEEAELKAAGRNSFSNPEPNSLLEVLGNKKYSYRQLTKMAQFKI